MGSFDLFRVKQHKLFDTHPIKHPIFQSYEQKLFSIKAKAPFHSTFITKYQIGMAKMDLLNEILTFMKETGTVDVSAMMNASDDWVGMGMKATAEHWQQVAMEAKATAYQKSIGSLSRFRINQERIGKMSLEDIVEVSHERWIYHKNYSEWLMQQYYNAGGGPIIGKSGKVLSEESFIKMAFHAPNSTYNMYKNAADALNQTTMATQEANNALAIAKSRLAYFKAGGISLAGYSIISDIRDKHYTHLLWDIPLAVLSFM